MTVRSQLGLKQQGACTQLLNGTCQPVLYGFAEPICCHRRYHTVPDGLPESPRTS